MSTFWTAGYAAAYPEPMSHSRILYASLSGTITASSEVEGFEAVLAGTPQTYSFWRPIEAPASWEIDFGVDQTVDCVGIAAHELSGQALGVDTWDGLAWVPQLDVEPQDGGAIVLLFAPVVTQKVRVRVDGLEAAIGVIYVGQALRMQRKEYLNLGQIDLKRQTEFEVNVSQGGQWLGRSIARIGLRASYTWTLLTDAWYLANMEAFSLSARELPFFLAARPLDYPAETVFAWVEADIQPQRMGVRDMCSVTIDVAGYLRA